MSFRLITFFWLKKKNVQLSTGTLIISIRCRFGMPVCGNKLADRLASTADITSGLQLGRAEMLGGLRNFLNMDRPEHFIIDCQKGRGLGEGSSQHSTFQGWKRSVFNQTNIGDVARATLGRLWSAYGPFRVLRCHM